MKKTIEKYIEKYVYHFLEKGGLNISNCEPGSLIKFNDDLGLVFEKRFKVFHEKNIGRPGGVPDPIIYLKNFLPEFIPNTFRIELICLFGKTKMDLCIERPLQPASIYNTGVEVSKFWHFIQ